MNQREKEKYLREYQILKEQGKPFFPYAVFKDSVMALIMAVIMIGLTLLLGAELGPQADPTTTTYVPRPDWYYFFLFELLRIIRDPNWLIMATIGIPTIALVLLVLLPFYDRGPERNPAKRPIAMTAMTMTIVAMGYLTILGATSGSPIDFDFDVGKKFEKGNSNGCPLDITLARLKHVFDEDWVASLDGDLVDEVIPAIVGHFDDFELCIKVLQREEEYEGAKTMKNRITQYYPVDAYEGVA